MTPELGQVLSRLESARKRGKGWQSRCPAHEDSCPSLSIGLGDNGCVLLHCFAGCSLDAILSALGLQRRDLCPPNLGLSRSRYANGRRLWRT